mgnify:FL=1
MGGYTILVSICRAYGPVQDVRIPYQQKRMFGFVTFIYPETVKMILANGNPHYICGARVLVKPYKEKGKHGTDRYCGFLSEDIRGTQDRYLPPLNLICKCFCFTNRSILCNACMPNSTR